jgi:hypothetical protein
MNAISTYLKGITGVLLSLTWVGRHFSSHGKGGYVNTSNISLKTGCVLMIAINIGDGFVWSQGTGGGSGKLEAMGA